MAAQAWKIYPYAKRNIANGNCSLTNASTAFNILLAKSTSNAALSAAILEHKASLTNEVASANGYSSSGKALGAVIWTMSGANVKFDCSNVIWTATGGAIGSIMYAVIYQSGASNAACHLLCYCSLTSGASTLAQNNTLEIQMASGGVFVLS